MKLRTHLLSLIRSPLKTLLTLLLLAAAAFLFLYNLAEYCVADREYREARDQYEGVLTVEEQPVPDQNTFTDFFLLSDETGRNSRYGTPLNENYPELTYENYHQKSLGEDVIEKLSALPYISRVEHRYLTAGVSSDYSRLDTDKEHYAFTDRCVMAATVKSRFLRSVHDNWGAFSPFNPELETDEFVILEDVELLAGDPAWLWNQIWEQPYEELALELKTARDEIKGTAEALTLNLDGRRLNVFVTENLVYPEDSAALQPGKRCVLVLRNADNEKYVSPTKEFDGVYPSDYFKGFDIGDDSLLGWWPYFTDITGLPENWLQQDAYADLRELIRVTNDDIHTFDVVYCDDMAAQRRVSESRMICEDGRFIGPKDAGQAVCVVSTDFLDTNGLKIGDTLTLDLGNYLSEQYAPLGAVAVARGRQSTAFTTQTFTIIGAWRDLNEGSHPFRDWYWCWSNNAIFVPTAFLPECRNAQEHEFKPSEVSFIVGNAEEITAFVEECLPQVEAMGLTYSFSDNGWLLVAKDLMRARGLARVKLLIFAGAALFALVLTVWLFIGRKKREYGILRALGMPKGEAGTRLFVPFLLLGLVSALIGLLAAWLVTARQLTADHAPASLSLFLMGALGFLALLAVMAYIGLLVIRRESILSLTQEKQK